MKFEYLLEADFFFLKSGRGKCAVMKILVDMGGQNHACVRSYRRTCISIHLKRYNNGKVKKAIKLSGNQNIRLS